MRGPGNRAAASLTYVNRFWQISLDVSLGQHAVEKDEDYRIIDRLRVYIQVMDHLLCTPMLSLVLLMLVSLELRYQYCYNRAADSRTAVIYA